MVQTYEFRFPPSPNLEKVTVTFDKLNNTDLSSRGGLVVERLLHKKCHSATVDRIPSSMVYQSFGGRGGGTHVAIPTAERRAFGFMIHALMLAVNNNTSNCESLSIIIAAHTEGPA